MEPSPVPSPLFFCGDTNQAQEFPHYLIFPLQRTKVPTSHFPQDFTFKAQLILSYTWKAMKGVTEKRKRLGLLVLHFLICGGIFCSFRALFRLISLKVWKREKTLMFTRYNLSQILQFVCVETSPEFTGLGSFGPDRCFGQVATRIPRHHKWKFFLCRL